MVAIATQYRALDALVNFRQAEEDKAKVLERLGSGERISRSVEDIVDLDRSDSMRADMRALRQVKRGNFDAVNTLQLIDEHLQEATDILTRVSELATRSASDTQGPDGSNAKQANDQEFQELVANLDQLNQSVDFNGTLLFDVGFSYTVNLNSEVTGAADQVAFTTTPIDAATLGIGGTDLLTSANADAVIAAASTAIDDLSRLRGGLGAVQKRLIDNMDQIDTEVLSLQEEESRIRDADVAEETVNLTRADLLIQSNVAVMAQANLTRESVFQLIN